VVARKETKNQENQIDTARKFGTKISDVETQISTTKNNRGNRSQVAVVEEKKLRTKNQENQIDTRKFGTKISDVETQNSTTKNKRIFS
jgi:hypothetical protein